MMTRVFRILATVGWAAWVLAGVVLMFGLADQDASLGHLLLVLALVGFPVWLFSRVFWPPGAAGWKRSALWLVLLVLTVPLISLSFILVPALLLMLPWVVSGDSFAASFPEG